MKAKKIHQQQASTIMPTRNAEKKLFRLKGNDNMETFVYRKQ